VTTFIMEIWGQGVLTVVIVFSLVFLGCGLYLMVIFSPSL